MPFFLKHERILLLLYDGSVEEAQVIEPSMEAYDEFLQRVQDIHRLSALQGHLGWDQEVLMPSKGASSRGEMMAWLAVSGMNN